MSSKQKLNAKSSAEAELVGADDSSPMMSWAKYFMEAQGYEITDNASHQDDQSAIPLEKNGPASAGKRSRHLNVRYFFIADRRSDGDCDIRYCPTDVMTGDFFTKPLQGKKFKRHRNYIMGHEFDKTGK